MLVKNPIKIILLWIILIITMILHFNYHVGGIFYDVNIVVDGANGTVPSSTHIIRNVFYHLPIIWILLLLMNNSKILRLCLFIISVLYTVSHAMHLFKDITPFNHSQTPLLAITLVVSIFLSIQHFKYWKANLTPIN